MHPKWPQRASPESLLSVISEQARINGRSAAASGGVSLLARPLHTFRATEPWLTPLQKKKEVFGEYKEVREVHLNRYD